ncbi:MAG TPA: 4-hydroxy-tetrahydrodipicolinate reductase [Steroidobacteraceae bacterium]|nr:4-hydroxy-tetrahydrodipicolinate reductase [Steroidobacteraceae bacterium]
MIRLVLIGATGRMGGALLRLLPEFPSLRLQAALAGPRSARLGRDCGELAGVGALGVPVTADLDSALKDAGLALSFSAAQTAGTEASACAAAGVPLLMGTSGLVPPAQGALQEAARSIPVLIAANTSLGVALLEELVRRAAAVLPEDFDIQVQDIHHRDKLDSPSGTALALGAAAAEGRKIGAAPGYAALRGGDVIGEHEVRFLGPGEQLRLGHAVTDRAVFARGALRAGCWLTAQKPGVYRMADALEK